MHIAGLTSSQVWSASARSLTNFGSGALASTSIVLTTLAGGANVDLRASAGIVALTNVAVVTGVGATLSTRIDSLDGTNTILLTQTAAAASAAAAYFTANTAGVGPRILNNDATHAATYQTASISLTI